ncbi:hypothetical protein [uncultured Jannaschia sp.]|uniref:hypothetical protein n=1 Tax=uncultured Jannaschia sp. TaxID=293347 RepID=UPI0026341D06|nr:hypothetical protein [uncultured Jannaschia sp.]
MGQGQREFYDHDPDEGGWHFLESLTAEEARPQTDGDYREDVVEIEEVPLHNHLTKVSSFNLGDDTWAPKLLDFVKAVTK